VPHPVPQFGALLASEVKVEKPKTMGVLLPQAAGARVIHHRDRTGFTLLMGLCLPAAADTQLQLVAEEFLVGLYLDARFKTGPNVDKPAKVEVRTPFSCLLRGSLPFSQGSEELHL
jgi:hypothetical protein